MSLRRIVKNLGQARRRSAAKSIVIRVMINIGRQQRIRRPGTGVSITLILAAESTLFLAIPDDFFCGVMAGGAGDAAAGVGAGATHIEAFNRGAAIAMAQNRPGAEYLIQTKVAMHDVALGQAKDPFQT